MFENWTNWFEKLAKCENCGAPMMVSSLCSGPWQYNEKSGKWEHDCAKAKYRKPIEKLEVVESYSKSKCNSTFNGKNIEDLSEEDRKEIFHYLLKRAKELHPNGNIDLMRLVSVFQHSSKDCKDIENPDKPLSFSTTWTI